MPEPNETDQPDRAIRAALAEVWNRITEWRQSPHWQSADGNQTRYERSAAAVTVANAARDTMALVDAVGPILDMWRPHRAGLEQAIFAAVDRLRAAVADATG